MPEVGKIVDLLVQEKYLTQKDADLAKLEAEKKGLSVIDYLLANNIVSKKIIGEAQAEQYKIKYFDLGTQLPEKNLILKIPKAAAEKLRIILVKETGSELTFATDKPSEELKNQLKEVSAKHKSNLVYSFSTDIDQALSYYQSSLSTRFDQIIKNNEKIGPQLIDEIIKEAVLLKSSDIHFEPQKDHVLIRLRVDGSLQEAGTAKPEFYDVIINRIKVLSRLRIDEHNSVQDGSMQVQINERSIDLRISVVPTVNGEKIAIRILTEYISLNSLENLGISDEHKSKLELAIKKPHGMIVVTGPTGSGKTTTLYTVLNAIKNPTKNITTIEDPVEYHFDGINQIQVNQATKLTFASGLRSIVRQDPDIILVGEIRDKETAGIAVNAALTGHLLLTTLHANDSATAIPRLIDMGVEPFLVSSTLELVIAQRLVRRVCTVCRFGSPYTYSNKLGIPEVKELEGTTIYSGKGCSSCNGTGYKGRVAIFEIIEINSEIKELIYNNPNSAQIWELAKKQGAKSLFEDGIDKIKQGLTTLDEVTRVAEKI